MVLFAYQVQVKQQREAPAKLALPAEATVATAPPAMAASEMNAVAPPPAPHPLNVIQKTFRAEALARF